MNPQEVEDARNYYWVSSNGKEGARFLTISPAALTAFFEHGPEAIKKRPAQHVYEVTGRLEDGGEVLVRAQFVEER